MNGAPLKELVILQRRDQLRSIIEDGAFHKLTL